MNPIISRTPLRISFVGGGTDIPDFYRKFGGEVISTAIDKYITVKVFSADEYGDTGIVSEVLDRQTRRIVNECLQITGVTDVAIEIESDIPPRSGLGGSSAFTVGMLNALYHAREYVPVKHSPEYLASKACEIEIEKLGGPIGKQDQYAGAYGGFNYMFFYKDDRVVVSPMTVHVSELEKSLLLFYTGIQRDANTILHAQKKDADSKTLWCPRP